MNWQFLELHLIQSKENSTVLFTSLVIRFEPVFLKRHILFDVEQYYNENLHHLDSPLKFRFRFQNHRHPISRHELNVIYFRTNTRSNFRSNFRSNIRSYFQSYFLIGHFRLVNAMILLATLDHIKPYNIFQVILLL